MFEWRKQKRCYLNTAVMIQGVMGNYSSVGVVWGGSGFWLVSSSPDPKYEQQKEWNPAVCEPQWVEHRVEHKLCANISGSELKQRELCEKGKLETLISCVQEWLPQSEEARQCGDPPQASSSPMSHPCPRSLSLSLAISLSLSLSLSLPLSPSLSLSLCLSLSLSQFSSIQFSSIKLLLQSCWSFPLEYDYIFLHLVMP